MYRPPNSTKVVSLVKLKIPINFKASHCVIKEVAREKE